MENEKRLIEANALKQMFDEREADDVELYGGFHIVECFPADDAKEIVDKCPTVDAVEVVRCKDCKHYGRIKGLLGLRCDLQGEQIWCKDDFCSYGERRDDGG